MKNWKRTTLVALLAVVLSVATASAMVYDEYARAQASEDCGPMKGLAGVLQKVGVLNQKCNTTSDGHCYSEGQLCSNSGGKCTSRQTNSGIWHCNCK